MRPFTTIILFLLLLPLFSCEKKSKIDPRKLKEGDLIFQENWGRQSKAVKLATHSRYTHVGVIFKHNGRLLVMEAVQPVRITGLRRFISRGVNKHFVIKRLKERKKLLTQTNIKKMKTYGRKFLGKNYDIYFGWSNRRIYCSELVWKIYYKVLKIKVGKLQKLREFDLSHPFVKRLMRIRYGTKIPYNEPVISPAAMYNSKLLKTVCSVN